MMIIILIGICGFVYLFFNELEDESIKSNWNKHKQFLNTRKSWKNKWYWKNGERIKLTEKYWYYFGFTPFFKERFYLSSTVLVFLTDGEHLFQFVKNLAILAGFFVIGWEFGLAWFVGKSVGQIIKEKINWIQ